MAQVGRHNGASQQVLTYLRQHANTAIPHEEIRLAIGAKNKFTIANAISNLISTGITLERPMAGMVIYRTMPLQAVPDIQPEPEPETPTQKLYEFVGNSGPMIVVRGEDDELYVVLPLDKFMNG